MNWSYFHKIPDFIAHIKVNQQQSISERELSTAIKDIGANDEYCSRPP